MSALCKRLFLFPPTKVKNRVGQKVARIWINWMMTWCLYSPSHIHPNCESSRVIAPIGKCLQVKREIGGRSAMKDNPRGKLWGSLWQGKCSLSTKNKKKKKKSRKWPLIEKLDALSLKISNSTWNWVQEGEKNTTKQFDIEPKKKK
jgi:hypothetical protein